MLLAARAERAERLRLALLEAFGFVGHPGFAVSLQEVVAAVVGAMKEQETREFRDEIRQACRGLGARMFHVGRVELVRGVRRRGRTLEEALWDARELKIWARATRSRPPPG